MLAVQIADPTFLTPAEAADLLRISRQTLYSLIESGEIPAKRVGGQWRIPKEAIEEVAIYKDTIYEDTEDEAS